MRILKYLIFLLLIATIGIAIYIAIQPDEYKIIKTRVINAPISLIRSYTDDYTKWPQWGVWHLTDPQMKLTYGEKSKGDSAVCYWDSKIYGTGNITTNYFSKDSISQLLNFTSPQKNTARRFWSFHPTASGESVIVTSGIEGRFSFIDKFFILFNKSREHKFDEDFAKGLQNLDSVVTLEMKRYSIDTVGATQYGGGFYLYQTVSAKISNISRATDRIFPEISAYMEQNNISSSGNSFVQFIEWDTIEKTVVVSAAIPVSDRIITPNDSSILCGYTPAGNYYKTTLYGDYSNTKEAWAKARESLKKSGYSVDPRRKEMEIYVKRPKDYPNPADLVTDIYIPILNSTN